MCPTSRPKKKSYRKRKPKAPPPPPPVKLLHERQWVCHGLTEQILAHRNAAGLTQENPVPILLGRDSKPAKLNSTEYTYQGKWTSLLKFSALVGDYRSCLLLDRDLCPDLPPPVDAATAAHFVSYMTLPAGTPVMHYRTDAPVLDRNGTPIIANGTWNCPNNVYRFSSAIKALHDLYDHLRSEIPYLPECVTCLSLNENSLNSNPPLGHVYLACRTCHAAYGRARVMMVGNVVSDPSLKKHCIKARKRLGETHQVKGNIQLLPGEIRTLRSSLLTGCETEFAFLENLKFYTLMLVGINLFLRSDEILSMKVEDFQDDLTIIRPNYGVRALVVKVQGKCDAHPYSLILWSNDEFPEFCPVRHLLCYLKMSGIKSGFLFPPPGCRQENPTKGYPYDLVLDRMKVLCTGILRREGRKGEFGTHIFRKTGYLFAIFGYLKRFEGEYDDQGRLSLPKMTMASIMRSARHKAVCNAATYMRDSFALYTFATRAQVMHEHDVGVWQDINIMNASPFTRMLHNCRMFQRPIENVSTWYVETYLSLLCDGRTPFEFILQEACKKDSKGNSQEQLVTLLREKLSGSDLQEALSLVTSVKSDCTSLAYCTSQLQQQEEAPTACSTKKRSFSENNNKKDDISDKSVEKPSKSPDMVDGIPMKPAKKGRIYGKNDLESRKSKSWNLLSNEQRLSLLWEIAFEQGYSDLTNAARTFTTNWARPVSKCVVLCHSGCKTSFMGALGGADLRPNCSTNQKYTCQQCAGAHLPSGVTFAV